VQYHISENGLHFIEHFEGFRADRYQNPGDVPTIGYGTTAGAGVVDPLPETCTETEAEHWLEMYVNRSVIPSIEAALTAGHRVWNQNQIDAACSFGYNLGAGIFQVTHTIGQMIRDHGRTHKQIGNAFLLYDDPGTIYQNGLLTRREAERALFDRPEKKQ
jgi:GH24 family phage-related lysozyme (muramidase)